MPNKIRVRRDLCVCCAYAKVKQYPSSGLSTTFCVNPIHLVVVEQVFDMTDSFLRKPDEITARFIEEPEHTSCEEWRDVETKTSIYYKGDAIS